MYLKKPSRIMTFSCNERSSRLRPEWRCRDRRYKITHKESEQYWNHFFCPPPAILLFHLSSEQWWQCKKYVWRWSLVVQISIASSSSLNNLPRWRRWINFFDAAQSEIEYFLGSTSVRILSPISIVLVDGLAESRLCGFAVAFDRHAKQ